MKLFDFVCNNEEMVVTLVRYRVMPENIHFNVDVYRRYLEYRQSNKRTQSIENVADDVRQSSRNITRIIEKMEQEV